MHSKILLILVTTTPLYLSANWRVLCKAAVQPIIKQFSRRVAEKPYPSKIATLVYITLKFRYQDQDTL